jgi:subtilisin-like proprotein convertase family protein
MAAAVYNFFIEQGSAFQITFEYLNNDNSPVDLTNYCVRLRMKDNNNIVRLYTSNPPACINYTLLKSSSGSIVWTLTSSATKDFTFDFANYDLDLIESSSTDSLRISTGRIEVIKNNFPECITGNDSRICSSCESITCEDSSGFSLFPITPTPTEGGSGVSPTPTPTIGNPCDIVQEDLCGYLCQNIDMFGKLYSGSGLTISDNSIVSGIIAVPDTGVITNVELGIDSLKHTSHQDISIILVPPSGNKILLSSHNKIKNYNTTNGTSFAFSNRALPGTYLNNRSSDFYVNILDKTNIYKFSNDTLTTNLTGLVGHSCSGDWTLIIRDDDIGGSGSISGWNLVLTYEPPPYSE